MNHGAGNDWPGMRWELFRAIAYPIRTGRGAHRADYEPSAWSAGEVVDVFGLRRNETTGQFHPSRLVGK